MTIAISILHDFWLHRV